MDEVVRIAPSRLLIWTILFGAPIVFLWVVVLGDSNDRTGGAVFAALVTVLLGLQAWLIARPQVVISASGIAVTNLSTDFFEWSDIKSVRFDEITPLLGRGVRRAAQWGYFRTPLSSPGRHVFGIVLDTHSRGYTPVLLHSCGRLNDRTQRRLDEVRAQLEVALDAKRRNLNPVFAVLSWQPPQRT